MLITLCAALAGCSDDGKATVLPTLTATPSASPTPTPVVTSTGKDAPTPEGAAAFARFFYSEITRSFDEKDPNIVRSLSAPECKVCQEYAGSIGLLRDKDQRLSGRLVFTIAFAEAPATSGMKARVDVRWSTPALKRYDAGGRLINDQPALTNHDETVLLVRQGDRWLVSELA